MYRLAAALVDRDLYLAEVLAMPAWRYSPHTSRLILRQQLRC